MQQMPWLTSENLFQAQNPSGLSSKIFFRNFTMNPVYSTHIKFCGCSITQVCQTLKTQSDTVSYTCMVQDTLCSAELNALTSAVHLFQRCANMWQIYALHLYAHIHMHIHKCMHKYVQISVCKYIVSAVKNFIITYGNVKFHRKMPPAKVKLFCLISHLHLVHCCPPATISPP